MLKHHSLAISAKASVGTVYEAMDRRSQTIKTLLLPKRRLAWVALLSEQLNPVRLRSGRIALIGALDAFAELSEATRPPSGRRRFSIWLAALIFTVSLVVLLALVFRQTSFHTAGDADSRLSSTARSDSAGITSSHSTVDGQHCDFENALQNTATARKLYLLKADLASRFHARFDLQSPIGGVAKVKAKACNASFEVTFVRDQRGWRLNEVSKD
jgi:hypothetical protein